MSMAHSVEGRFPFLDHRVVEFCNRLPSNFKQLGLQEKWLLRKLAHQYVPREIWQRTKRPYRAPIQRTFFSANNNPEYVTELLAESAIQRSGYFNAASVGKLVKKAKSEARLSEVDEMALIGVLSTQLVDNLFVHAVRRNEKLEMSPGMKVVEASSLTV